MKYKSIAKKIIAEKTIHVVVANIRDDEGVDYVSYMLIKGDNLINFENNQNAKMKLEDYGMVYCSIPGSSVSQSLENEILNNIKCKCFVE